VTVKELAYRRTPLGELTLRRRTEPRLGASDVYEVKLGDEFLMSSLFTESERELSVLGLEGLSGDLDVVVGGLGLGYTAVEALNNPNVVRLLVLDLFQDVIDWHIKGLVPNGSVLTIDGRCELRQGDFFELARIGFDAASPGRKFDAVLLDIDHSPKHHLSPDNRALYTVEGLSSVRNQLKLSGTFAMWSDDPPDTKFTQQLRYVFGTAEANNIEFPNPYTQLTSVNTVYVAHHTND
jgi:spermidine synthase